jgi:hypothetical protein
MLPCRRASELISEAMDRRLSLRERFFLRIHLLLCGACRTYRRQLALIRRSLREGARTVDDLVESAGVGLSAEARERIARAIDRR